MTDFQTCKSCDETKPLDAFERQHRGGYRRSCKDCRAAQRAAKLEAQQAERGEREASVRDDIWAAMKRGRSTRALQAVKSSPQGSHRIRVKDTAGFISIGELACRHAEREACRRAAKSCKTYEAAAGAVRILEQATPTFERTRQMKQSWLTLPPPRPIEALQHPDSEPEDDNDDAFGEAFGDWSPAWMLAALAAG
ncbi:MAG: hypothetical protein CL820_12890 [Croceicoccus sp.]|nr:hypothetical protein [Croceicoccus sp.]MAL26758.1 hypothetical protein [Croceicoccus sp.]|tara:strand:+ start:41031 stop:41615 length:585 start_codon:yes stop_codon:yes gene_type:complete